MDKKYDELINRIAQGDFLIGVSGELVVLFRRHLFLQKENGIQF